MSRTSFLFRWFSSPCWRTRHSYFFILYKQRHLNSRLSKCIRFPRNGRELRRPICPKFPAAASSIKRGRKTDRERERTRTGFVGRCYATPNCLSDIESVHLVEYVFDDTRMEWLWKGECSWHTFQFFNFHIFNDYKQKINKMQRWKITIQYFLIEP